MSWYSADCRHFVAVMLRPARIQRRGEADQVLAERIADGISVRVHLVDVRLDRYAGPLVISVQLILRIEENEIQDA